MTRICPSCGSVDWERFLEWPTARVLTTDQRVSRGRLAKVICRGCGVVANAQRFSAEEAKALYSEEYQLNTSGGEEHLFFGPQGPVPRSQVIYDWIAEQLPDSISGVIEVGCGEGQVLQRFARRGVATIGVEGSRRAVELARAKGLDVGHNMILSSDIRLPQAYVVYSYGVIEHVEDLDALVSVMLAAVEDGGWLVFGLPVQDSGGYDCWFSDHVWHFTIGQVRRVLERRGVEIVRVAANHPINLGAALFVCKRRDLVEMPVAEADHRAWREMQVANRQRWADVLAKVDTELAKLQGKKLAVYGSGEVLSLLMAYTTLSDANVVACIDEDESKIGTTRHNLPVQRIESLGGTPLDAVLLTVNPRYDAQIRSKLAPFGIPTISCLT